MGPSADVAAKLSLPPKTEPLSLCHWEGFEMARKGYSDEECLRILRQIEVEAERQRIMNLLAEEQATLQLDEAPEPKTKSAS